MTRDSAPATYEFCIGGETLGRRRRVGHVSIALCGEAYFPGLQRWRLASEVMDEAAYPAVNDEDAAKLVGDAALLRAPCPDPADLAPHTGQNSKERLDWLDQAIAATVASVRAQEAQVLAELPWASPGSWDYDFQIDSIAWIKRAHRTLECLLEEKDGLLTGEAMRRA